MGVASMVLGIISLVLALFGGAGGIAFILGLIGIILGAVGKMQKANCAVAGLTLSIISTSLGLIFWIACALILESSGFFDLLEFLS